MLFLKYNRQEGQSLINFVTKLKLFAVTCEYGKLENSIIRDQLVVLNTSDPQLQERLISMDDLTLEKAIEIIKQSENVKEQVKLINKVTYRRWSNHHMLTLFKRNTFLINPKENN